MARRNQRHRREARYIAAVCRQLGYIEAYRRRHDRMPAPIEDFLRRGDDRRDFEPTPWRTPHHATGPLAGRPYPLA